MLPTMSSLGRVRTVFVRLLPLYLTDTHRIVSLLSTPLLRSFCVIGMCFISSTVTRTTNKKENERDHFSILLLLLFSSKFSTQRQSSGPGYPDCILRLIFISFHLGQESHHRSVFGSCKSYREEINKSREIINLVS